jgi:hypothetical protein
MKFPAARGGRNISNFLLLLMCQYLYRVNANFCGYEGTKVQLIIGEIGVHFSHEELGSLFDETHVAIGGLGNHRNGAPASATLKTTECCSQCIPLLTSYKNFGR